jgi:hypothetical protein
VLMTSELPCANCTCVPTPPAATAHHPSIYGLVTSAPSRSPGPVCSQPTARRLAPPLVSDTTRTRCRCWRTLQRG